MSAQQEGEVGGRAVAREMQCECVSIEGPGGELGDEHNDWHEMDGVGGGLHNAIANLQRDARKPRKFGIHALCTVRQTAATLAVPASHPASIDSIHWHGCSILQLSRS